MLHDLEGLFGSCRAHCNAAQVLPKVWRLKQPPDSWRDLPHLARGGNQKLQRHASRVRLRAKQAQKLVY